MIKLFLVLMFQLYSMFAVNYTFKLDDDPDPDEDEEEDDDDVSDEGLDKDEIARRHSTSGVDIIKPPKKAKEPPAKPAEEPAAKEKEEEKPAKGTEEEEEVIPDKVKISDKIELDGEAFTKLYEKAKEDYGEGFDELEDKVKNNLMKNLYKAEIGEIATKTADKGKQLNAVERKRLEAENTRILEDNKKLQDAFKEHNAKIKDFEDEKKKYEAIIAKDAEDIDDDKERDDLLDDQRDAKRRLKDLEKQEKDLKKNAEKLIGDRDQIYYEYQANIFLQEFPWMNVDGGFAKVANDVDKGIFAGDELDEVKTELFTNIYTSYFAKGAEYRAKHNLADYTKKYMKLFPALNEFKPAESTTEEKAKNKAKKPKTPEEWYQYFLNKQKESAPPPPPTGKSGAPQPKDEEVDEDDQRMAKEAAERHGAKELSYIE